MTRKLPGEQALTMLVNDLDRDIALQACLHHGPRRIYAGLLHHARAQGWKPGWAFHAFKEIFGTGPRLRDQQGPPMPPPLELKAWISMRPKRSK
jgi:hypothetical protein